MMARKNKNLTEGIIKKQLFSLAWPMLFGMLGIVVFNLEGVRFIDSAGFGTLLHALEIAKARSSVFKICNVSDEVMELIELTELTDKLPICECAGVKEKIVMELDD